MHQNSNISENEWSNLPKIQSAQGYLTGVSTLVIFIEPLAAYMSNKMEKKSQHFSLYADDVLLFSLTLSGLTF